MNMMNFKNNRAITFLAGFGACLAVLLVMGAKSPEAPSPVKPASDRDVYYPNTEALGKDEMARLLTRSTWNGLVRVACFVALLVLTVLGLVLNFQAMIDLADEVSRQHMRETGREA